MKNNLADLNDHLFAMLEALNNDEEMEDPAKLDLSVVMHGKAFFLEEAKWSKNSFW